MAEPGDDLALVVRGSGDVGLEPRAVCAPTDNQVLVAPRHVGMCGTDLEIIDGTLDPEYVRLPLVLGHEWSGRVAAIGELVTDVKVGDPVVVEGIVPCGLCSECRTGRTNMCLTYEELGFTLDGAAGPGVVTPAHLVHVLAESVPLEAGALVEPAAVVLRGLSVIDLQPGASVLVVGDGTVGLLAAHLARIWSPSQVTVAGERPAQAALALAMGADAFVVTPVEPRSFDVTIEAAGSTAAVAAAIAAVKRGGQVLLYGISGHNKTVAVATDDLVNHDLSIRGSFSYTAAAWAETTRLLNTGRFAPLPLITHRFRLADYALALDALRSPGGGARGKVLLDMPSRS